MDDNHSSGVASECLHTFSNEAQMGQTYQHVTVTDANWKKTCPTKVNHLILLFLRIFVNRLYGSSRSGYSEDGMG